MDSEEDDISILPHCDDNDNGDKDIDVDAGFHHPIIPFSPFASSKKEEPHPGSHYALEKAYLTLKEKLKETQAQNVQLARKVQRLELEGSTTSGGGRVQESSSFLQGSDSGKAQEVSPLLSLGSTVCDASFVTRPVNNAAILFAGDQPSVSLRTVELESFVHIGESFDMMEDAHYMGESGGDGRKLTLGEMESLLNKYKDALGQKNQMVNSLSQQVAQLQEERRRLQQLLESERVERERERGQLQQTLQDQCRALEQERDKALKEAAIFQASLRKANVEVAMAKERAGVEGGSGVEANVELVNEVAHMKRVIDKLKTMVLLQKDCLVTQSMSISRPSLNSRPSMELPPMSSSSHNNNPNGSGGPGSGHSWEMVNGVTSPPHQPTSAEMRQQQLQQRSAKMIPYDSSGKTGNPSGNGGNGVVGNQNGAVLLNIQNGQTASSHQGSQSPIPRRNSENVIHSPRDPRVSEAAAPRSHTLPQTQQSQRGAGLAQWMGQHFSNRQQQQQQQQMGLNQFMKDAPNSGIGEPSPRAGSRSPSRHNSQPLGSGGGTQYPSSSSASSLSASSGNTNPTTMQRQPSPVGGLVSGTYDNIAMAAGTAATSTMTTGNTTSNTNTGPSMHILNQSSMTGGRVMQGGGSGSFPISTTTTTTTGGGVVAPAIPVAISRDGTPLSQGIGAGRGSPQEHCEVPSSSSSTATPPPLTPPSRSPRNPTDLELNTTLPQDLRFVNQTGAGNMGGGRNGGGGEEAKKCPVCNQDFSHITMDEFQTHVFDCFDDDDDLTSNAPETLQAPTPHNPPPHPHPHNPQAYVPVSAVVEGGDGGGGQGRGRCGVVAVNERSCPVCFKEFGDNVSQGFFEGHVQSHFEDVIDHFEELRP